jgi:hypothetical protein
MNLIFFSKKINLKYFIDNIFKKNIKKDKIVLGRWANENSKKTKLKIDYANEDHCGVCTKLLEKNVSNNKKNF